MSEKPARKTATALVLLASAHAAVLGVVIALAAVSGPAFQVDIFRDYADKIAAGELPYTDFPHEYPPLSLIILILPRLLTADPTLYAAFFGAQILVCDLVIMLILSRIGLKPMILYGIGMLLFWRVPFIRHDLVPVTAATVGAFALLRGRAMLAATLWGAGGALKLYPIVTVPALAFGASLRETFKRWTVAGLVFVGGIVWGIFAFGPETLVFLTYHSERPAQIESIPANIQLLLPNCEVVDSFGSFNVVGTGSETLVAFFGVFQILMVLLGLGVAFFQGRGSDMRAAAVRGAALSTFAFSVFGKVLAWHYLFWPLPLVAMAYALVGFRFPKATWGLYFAAILLTTAINEQYWAIDGNLPYFTAMLTVRNSLLVPLFVLMLLSPKDRQQQS
ncbi:MAG: glycosyltransferase 87 family protein [Rubrobacteraceae bacterium]